MLFSFPRKLDPHISLGLWLSQSFCAHCFSHCLSLSRGPATVMVSFLLWVRLDTLHKPGQTYSCTRQLLQKQNPEEHVAHVSFPPGPKTQSHKTGVASHNPRPLLLSAGLVLLWSTSSGVSSASPSPYLQVPFIAWLKSFSVVPSMLPPPDTTSLCPAWLYAHWRSLGKLKWRSSSG